MDSELPGVVFCLIAYFLGSIPFGVVFSYLWGTQDPRQAGSQNIGFTNVMRLSGKTVGVFTLIGDVGKGWLVGWIASVGWVPKLWGLMAVMAVLLGHLFPIFLKFRGGKGVATGLGGILGVHFPLGLLLVVIWSMAVGIWRYSSGGALTAFCAFPVASWFMTGDVELTGFSVLVSAFIIFRHKDNIAHLLQGTEPRIGADSL